MDAGRDIVLDAVKWALRQAGPTETLFAGLSLPLFEKEMREAAALTKLEPLSPTPHMLRHGGPSADVFLGARTLLQVQKRGRWNSMQSVKRYEKSAKLLRMVRLLPNDVVNGADKFVAKLRKAFASS